MAIKTTAQPEWKPQYGYRRTSGWRQKVLYGNEWHYPRQGGPIPSSLRFFVSARRRWRTIFFLKSLGLNIANVSGRRPTCIDVDVPPSFTAEDARRFVDHCRRSGLDKARLGLPGVRFMRFGKDREQAAHSARNGS